MARVFRSTPIDLDSLLKEQIPQIDLKIHAYEISSTNFLKAVSNYTHRAVTEISNRRNAQAAEKKKMLEKIQQMKAEINQCKVKEIELIATLEKEQEEKKEAELSVAAFKRQLSSLQEQCSALDGEIEQYRANVTSLDREKDAEHKILRDHSARLFPELAAYEDRLKCIIEGVEKDQLLIRFTYIDKSNPQREFRLVLDLSGDSYKALTSTPLLPTLPILIDDLNTSRNLYAFIKRLRCAFADLVQHS